MCFKCIRQKGQFDIYIFCIVGDCRQDPRIITVYSSQSIQFGQHLSIYASSQDMIIGINVVRVIAGKLQDPLPIIFKCLLHFRSSKF